MKGYILSQTKETSLWPSKKQPFTESIEESGTEESEQLSTEETQVCSRDFESNISRKRGLLVKLRFIVGGSSSQKLLREGDFDKVYW